jgi:hypothetical protein
MRFSSSLFGFTWPWACFVTPAACPMVSGSSSTAFSRWCGCRVHRMRLSTVTQGSRGGQRDWCAFKRSSLAGGIVCSPVPLRWLIGAVAPWASLVDRLVIRCAPSHSSEASLVVIVQPALCWTLIVIQTGHSSGSTGEELGWRGLLRAPAFDRGLGATGTAEPTRRACSRAVSGRFWHVPGVLSAARHAHTGSWPMGPMLSRR